MPYALPVVITDRDHNQLELQPVGDTLLVGTAFSPQLQWQFGPDAVRKLRDVCNAFIATNGEP